MDLLTFFLFFFFSFFLGFLLSPSPPFFFWLFFFFFSFFFFCFFFSPPPLLFFFFFWQRQVLSTYIYLKSEDCYDLRCRNIYPIDRFYSMMSTIINLSVPPQKSQSKQEEDYECKLKALPPSNTYVLLYNASLRKRSTTAQGSTAQDYSFT